MENISAYVILFLIVVILIILLTFLLKKRDSIDSEVSILGMKFKISTQKTQKTTSKDAPSTGVVLNGVKIKGSKIGGITGRDVQNHALTKSKKANNSSQVQIKDTEITDSEIDSISGRDVNHNK
jgi:hypothetical protein